MRVFSDMMSRQRRSKSEPIVRVRYVPSEEGVPFEPIIPPSSCTASCSTAHAVYPKSRRKSTTDFGGDLQRKSDRELSVEGKPVYPLEQAMPGQLRNPDLEHLVELDLSAIQLPGHDASGNLESSDMIVTMPTICNGDRIGITMSEDSLLEVAATPSTPAMEPKVGSALQTPLSQQYGSTSSRRSASCPFIPKVAHGLTLVFLAASDIVYFSEHRHDQHSKDILYLGLVLGLLYTCLIAWLVLHALFSDSSGRALQRTHFHDTTLIQGWCVLAVLHTGTAFVSSWWRQALQKNHPPGVRAAYVASTLQMLATVFYGIDGVSMVALSWASVLALIVLEVLHNASWQSVVDDTLPLASVGIACAFATSLTGCASQLASLRRALFYQLTDIFKLILTEQPNKGHSIETHLDQLVSRLEDAKSATQRSTLDPDLRDLLEATLVFFLNELTQLSSLDQLSIGVLQNAPPMTVEYVQRTLNQVIEEDWAPMPRLISPRSSEGRTPRSSEGRTSSLRSVSVGMFTPGSLRSATPQAMMCEGQLLPEAGGQTAFSPAGVKPIEEGDEAMKDETWRTTSTLSNMENPLGMEMSTKANLSSQLPKLENPSGQEDSADCEDRPDQTFNRGLCGMMDELRFCRRDELLPTPELSEELNCALNKTLGVWRLDIFKLHRLTGERLLIVVGVRVLANLVQNLDLEPRRISCFLDSIEGRYSDKPYHNSMHAADVINSMLYFLRLMQSGGESFEPVECLAALVAASSHDVGHQGLSNGFQVAAQTDLSRLYNDQSCLENMHASITFSVLTMDRANFLKGLPAPMLATFRTWVTMMILETDLSKHIQNVSRFKQEFKARRDPTVASTSARRKELAAFALKCCDVAHSAKPFDLHVLWTLRINDEFFQQGDLERQLGMGCSPFCDRNVTCVAESQVGFFDYIVSPLYTAIDEYLDINQLRVEVLPEIGVNRSFWKLYKGSAFNYADPQSNAGMLRLRFQDLTRPSAGVQSTQHQLGQEAAASTCSCNNSAGNDAQLRRD